MKLRIISGVLAAIFLVLLVLYGPIWSMQVVVLGVLLLAYREYEVLAFERKSWHRNAYLCVALLGTFVFLSQNLLYGFICFWLSVLGLFCGHVISANRSGDFSLSLRETSLEVIGFFYLVSLFGFIIPIVQLPIGRSYLLLLFLMVFLGDSIAYFVGMRFGKHRLAEKLSPKKSIEGAIGGGVASVGAALFWLHVIQPTISREWYWKMILFSVIGGMLAQFGDLFESLLKRSQQIKDSGQFLPGHGGILDRVDGLAIITPFFYFFLRFVLGES